MAGRFKRLLSFTLSFVLGISSVSSPVLAEESETEVLSESSAEVKVDSDVTLNADDLELDKEINTRQSEEDGADQLLSNDSEPIVIYVDENGNVTESYDSGGGAETDVPESTVSVSDDDLEFIVENDEPTYIDNSLQKAAETTADMTLTEADSDKEGFRKVKIYAAAENDCNTNFRIYFWEYDGVLPINAEDWESYFNIPFDEIVIDGLDETKATINLPIVRSNGSEAYTQAVFLNEYRNADQKLQSAYLDFTVEAGAKIDAELNLALQGSNTQDVYVMIEAACIAESEDDFDDETLITLDYLDLMLEPYEEHAETEMPENAQDADLDEDDYEFDVLFDTAETQLIEEDSELSYETEFESFNENIEDADDKTIDELVDEDDEFMIITEEADVDFIYSDEDYEFELDIQSDAENETEDYDIEFIVDEDSDFYYETELEAYDIENDFTESDVSALNTLAETEISVLDSFTETEASVIDVYQESEAFEIDENIPMLLDAEQVLYGSGTIDVYKKGSDASQAEYTITVADVPTNTAISLDSPEVTLDGYDLGDDELSSSLYYESYSDGSLTAVHYLMLDDNTSTAGIYVVTPYDYSDNAFDMSEGRLILDAHNTEIITVDIWPIQTNTLCESTGADYKQKIVSAEAMSFNAQNFSIIGEEGEKIDLIKLTGQEELYYGSIDPIDFSLTAFSECIIQDGIALPLDQNGNAVDGVELYMTFDHVYSFDVIINSIVNEHTEDNGDVYLWSGNTYYVDQYHYQGNYIEGYCRSQNTLGNCGIWVQLGRIREDAINSNSADFADYADVSYEDMIQVVDMNGYVTASVSDAQDHAPYGIAGPFQFTNGESDVTQMTQRVTGHIDDKFSVEEVVGSDIAYVVTNNSQFYTDWINLGSHASDKGSRAWMYWINDYYLLNNYEDQMSYAKISQKSNGEIQLEVDMPGNSGTGEQYDILDVELMTKRNSAIKADMQSNPDKYIACGVGFFDTANHLNHVQIRLSSSIETLINNIEYTGTLSVLVEDSSDQNTKPSPYVDIDINTDTYNYSYATQLKMDNAQESKALYFTSDGTDSGNNMIWVPLEDAFDPNKVKISVRICFTGILTGTDGSIIEYTADAPYVYETTLSEDLLKDAYDTCPNASGYDLNISFAEVQKVESEEFGQIILYKIWDDNSNVYNARNDVTEVSVSLERSQDGKIWEPVEAKDGRTVFTISGDNSEDTWRCILTNDDIDLTYIDDDNHTVYYQFRIVSESSITGVAAGYEYETDYNDLSVINSLNLHDFVEIKGEKRWLDDNGNAINSVSIPDSTIIAVLQDNEFYDMQIVSNDTDWKFSFTNLPKYSIGTEEHIYTVCELDSNGEEKTSGSFILLDDTWYIVDILTPDDDENDTGGYLVQNAELHSYKTVEVYDDTEDYDDDGKMVKPSAAMSYRITYQNCKDEDAVITITDNLQYLTYSGTQKRVITTDGSEAEDNNVTFSSGDGKTLSWSFTAGPYENGYVEFTVTVDDDAYEVGVIPNTATMIIDDDVTVVTNTVNNPVPVKSVDIDNDNDFDDDGEEVSVDDEITYDITYANGYDEARTIIITDKLDDTVEFVSCSDNGLYDDDTHTITWTLTDVAANYSDSVQCTVKITEDSRLKIEVENQAAVKVGNDSEIDTNIVENPVKPDDPKDPVKGVDTPVDENGLYDNDGAEVNLNDEVEYEIRFYNHNSYAATVTVTDILDVGLDYVSSSDNGSYDDAARTITWVVNNVPACSWYSVTFKATVNDEALVIEDGADIAAVDNTANIKIEVADHTEIETAEQTTNEVENPIEPDEPAVPIKGVDTPIDDDGLYNNDGAEVYLNDTLTYEIRFYNHNNTAATVMVIDTLDDGIDYVSSSDNGQYDDDTRTITWRIEDVPAFSWGYVTFTATVNALAFDAEDIVNGAEVSIVPNDPDFTVEQNTNEVDNPITPELIEISGTKIWNDANNQDAKRPSEITVKLYADNMEIDSKTVTGEDWIYSFTDLPKYANGVEIVYTIEEDTIDGYTSDITGYDITNSYTPEKTQINVRKVWEDSNNKDDVRPDDVTVELLRNGTSTGTTAILNDANSWSCTFSDLDKYESGKEIKWSVDEISVDEYESVLTGNMDDGYTFTNTHTLNEPKDPIKGVDTPADEDGLYNNDGAEVKLDDELEYEIRFYNHNSYPATVTVTDVLDAGLDYVSSSDNGQYDDSVRTITWTVENVPAHSWYAVTFKATVNETALIVEEGSEIADVENEAYVKIEVTDHPSIEVVENPTNEVENPIGPDEPTAPIKGVDTPIDDDGLYNNDGAEVSLYDTLVYEIRFYNHNNTAATVVVTDTLVDGLDYVSSSDNGQYDDTSRTITWTIENVPAFTWGSVTFNARVNTYAFDYDSLVNDADVSIIPNDPDLAVNLTTNEVENPLTPELVSVSGTKTWSDANNQDGKRPSEITVKLYANNVEYDSMIVTGDDWVYSFTDLPKYSNGSEIVYTIEEDTVDEYTSEITGYDITNSYTPEQTQISVRKVWEDSNNKDDARPDDVTVELVRNGVSTGTTAILDDSNNWSYIFTELDKYESGKEITWSVDEISVYDYESTLTGNMEEGYTITNTHTLNVPEDPVKGVDTPIDNDALYNNDGAEVNLGDILEYEVRFYNHNSFPATVTVTDVLDVGLDYVSSSDDGDYDEYTRTISWTVENVPAHSWYAVTFKASVNETALIVEEGTVFADVQNEALVKIEVTDHPAIEVVEQTTNEVENPLEPDDPSCSKGVDTPADEDGLYNNNGAEVYLGDILTYEITYYNHNNESATVTITDVLDKGLDYISSSDNGTYDEKTRTITWKIRNVPAFTSRSVTFEAQVNALAFDSEGVANEAYLEIVTSDDLMADLTTNEVDNPVTPELIDVSGVKTWDDANDQDAKRPSEVAVRLYADNVEIDSTVMTADDWSYSFTDLPKYANGQEIVYTISEDAVDGYTSEITDYGITNSYTPEKTQISVKKVWEDSNNKDDTRPESVTVELLRNGVPAGATAELNDGNGWAYVFSDLDKYENGQTITWSVDEISVDEYESLLTGDMETGYIITNTHTANVPQNPVKGVDTPVDDDGLYNNDGAEVSLGDTVEYEVRFYNHNSYPATVTVTDVLDIGLDYVSSSDDGIYDDSSRTITWTVKNVPAHSWYAVTFKATVNDTALIVEDGSEIADVENDALVKIEVTDHPAIEVVEQSTNEVENPIEPDEPENPIKGVDSPIDSDGLYNNDEAEVYLDDTLTYEIRFYNHNNTEATVVVTDVLDDGLDYISSSNNGQYDNITRTITWTIENVPAFTWGSVTFNASVNALAFDAEKIVNGADVNIITNDPDFTVKQSTNEVENPVTPELIDISGSKTWNDAHDQDAKRPSEITVRLYADNVEVDSVTVFGDDWSYSFNDLPKYANGNEIVYTISEDAVDGYTSEIADYDISNSYTPEQTQISVRKVWEDSNNKDDVRPESVTVELLKNGIAEGTTAVLNDSNSWTYVFSNLDKYENGKEIIWSVDEVLTDEYESVITGDMAEGYIITNTHTLNVPEDPVKGVDTPADDDGLYNNNGDEVSVGDILEYEVRFYNHNSYPASVTVTDVLDAGLDYVSSSDNGKYDYSTRTIVWTVDNVPAHTWNAVTFKASVNSTALIVEDGTDVADVENDAVVKIEVKDHPAIDAVEESTNEVENPIEPDEPENPIKNVDTPIDSDGLYNNDGDSVSFNDILTYEIRFYNHNNTEATVIITDTLDDGLDYISSSDNGQYNNTTRTITWTIENVSAFTWGSVTFDASVNALAFDFEQIVNDADVSIVTLDPDYTVEQKTNEVENPVTPELVDISGVKTWDDADNQDGRRPADLTVRLYANNVEVDVQTVTGDDWTYSFTDLPKYSNGQEIVYTIAEDIVDGYTSEITGYDITNSYTPEHTQIRVRKVWEDQNNKDDVRPDSVTVELLKNGNATGTTAELNDSNNWSYAFTNLDKYDNGNAITWSVAEISVDEYETVLAGSMAEGYTITNTHTANELEDPVKGVDTPIDNDGLYNNDGVEVRLGDTVEYEIRFYNHNSYPASATITDVLDAGLDYVSSSDNGQYDESDRTITWTVEDVPAHTWYAVTFKAIINEDALIVEDGSEIADVENDAFVKIEVTDHPTIEVIEQTTNEVENPIKPDEPTAPIKGVDTPIDDDGLYNNDGAEVSLDDILTYEIRFYNHDNTAATVVITDVLDTGLDYVSSSDNGQYNNNTRTITWTIENVPAFSWGSVTFSAKVNTFAFDTGDIVNDADVSIITNDPNLTVKQTTNEVENPVSPELVDVSGAKTWDDAGNQDGKRPAELTVRLYANNVEVDVQTVTGNDWTYSFTDLPKYSNGQEIVYTIAEDIVDGYTSSITGYDITNSYTPEHTQIRVRKVWEDQNNKDDVRPETVTVELMKNGNSTGTTAKLNDGNNWSCVFTDLDRYENGTAITWSVDEIAVDEYESVMEGNMTEGYTITNTHTLDEPENPVKGVDTSADDDGLYNNDGDEVCLGDTVEYEIRFYNHSSYPASVTVTDVLDAGLDFISASDNGQYNDSTRTITWTIENVSAHTWYAVTFKATVNDIALIVEDKTEIADVRNDALVKIEVTDHPAIEVVEQSTNEVENPISPDEPTSPIKDVDTPIDDDGLYNNNGAEVSLDDILTYEIRFYNHNNTEATAVITDVLDDGLDYVSSSDNGQYDNTTRTITWTIDNVPAFTWGSVTFNAKVNTFAFDSGDIVNDADVSIISNDPAFTVNQTTNEVDNPVVPEFIDISGKKTWTDADNQDAKRPSEITVRLYADNVEVDSRLVTGDDWSYSFTDLPKYANGNEIVYTISEDAIDGYTSEIIDYDITNSYTPERTQISVRKVWEDSNDKDEVRPASVTVELLKNGNSTGTTAELNEGNNWTYVFSDLDRYDNGNIIKWSVDELAVDEYESVVEGSMTEGYIITNTHTLNVPEEPVKGVDTPVDDDGLYNNDGAEVSVGDTLKYEIRFYNHNSYPAAVTVTDILDDGLDYVSASDNGQYDDATRTITWTVESVPAHTWYAVTFEAAVNDMALIVQEGTEIASVDNDALVKIEVTDHPAIETIEQSTNKVENPLSPDEPTAPIKGVDTPIDNDGLYNNDGAEVNVNDTLEYEIRFYNHNDMSAAVAVTDVLDAGLDFVSASDNGSYDDNTRTITWFIENVPAYTWGSVTFKAVVNDTAMSIEDGSDIAAVCNNANVSIEVPNHAEIETVEMTTNEVENPIVSDEPTVPIKGVDTPIDTDGLFNNDGAEVNVNDTVEYEICFYNHNNMSATITVTDVLDAGLDFVSASDNGFYDGGTRTITWVVENVPAYTWSSVTFKAVINETALIIEDNADIVAVDNTADVMIEVADHPEIEAVEMSTNEVENPIEPDEPVAPVKEVDSPIDNDGEFNNDGNDDSLNDIMTYQVRFYNHNNRDAQITVTDVLDVGLDFVSASDDGTYEETTRTVTWNLEDVPAFSWGTVTLEASINDESLVIEDGASTAAVDNIAVVRIEVLNHPEIAVSESSTNEVENPIEMDDPTEPVKGVDTPIDDDGLYNNDGETVNIGDTLTYEVRFYNHNNHNAQITVTDVLDDGLDFIYASDDGVYDDSTRTITWIFEDFPAYTRGSVTLEAVVNDAAIIIEDGADIASVDNEASVKIEVTDHPEIEAVEMSTNTVSNPLTPDDAAEPVKGVDTAVDNDGYFNNDGENVTIGEIVSYEISAYNHNNMPATVTITDVLDIGLDFVNASDNALYNEETRTITWTIENVPAYTWYSVTFNAMVNDDALIIGAWSDIAAVDNQADIVIEVPNHSEIESVQQQTNIVENPIAPDNPALPIKNVDTPVDDDGLYNNNHAAVNVGDVVEYEVRYYNHNDMAAEVTVTDVLDVGLDFVSASDDGIYDDTTRTITWVVENASAYTWGTVTFKATVNDKACIIEDGADIAAVNNSADVKIEVSDHPEIETAEQSTNEVENPIVSDDPTNPIKGVDTPVDEDGQYNNDGAEVLLDDDVEYEIRFYNHYNRPANAVVTDVLDIGLDFVSASDNGVYDENTRIITWTLEDIPAFSWACVTFRAAVNANALIIEDGASSAAVDNKANVTLSVPYKEGDPDDPWNDDEGNPLNDLPDTTVDMETNMVENPIRSDTQTQPVKGVDTEIDEDGLFNNDGAEVRLGECAEYEVRFYNHNAMPAEITVTDVLDEGLDFVSASDDGTYDSETRTITWILKDVPAYSWSSVTFKAAVNESAYIIKNSEYAAVYNNAVVSIEVIDHPEIEISRMQTNTIENPVSSDNLAAPVKGVDTAADNDGLFNNDGDNVTIGESVSYEVLACNHNSMPSTVTITDVLDIGLDFENASDNGVYDDETRMITWTIENVPAYTWVSVTFTAVVNDSALIVETDDGMAAVDNKADVTIEVSDHPEIEIVQQSTNTVENPVNPDTQAMPTKNIDTPADDDLLYNNNHEKVNVDDIVEYEVRYYNHNSMPATVTVTDILDEGLSFISASDNGVYDKETRTLSWVIKQAPAYTWGTVTFKAMINSSALDENGSNIAEVINSAEVRIEVADHPEIEVTEQSTNDVENPLLPDSDNPTAPIKGVDTPIDTDGLYNNDGDGVLLNDEVEYEIRFYNHYNREANAIITDVLDDGLDFVSASDNGVYDNSTRIITWTVENIPAFSWGSVTFKAEVNTNAFVIEEGTDIAAIDNKADVVLSVPYVEGDPDDPWNDSEGNPDGVLPDTAVSMETNNVENPVKQDEPTEPIKGVDTEVDADGLFNNDGAEVAVDECVEYEIRFYNHYNREANAAITDALDAGLDFVSASDEGIYDEETRVITWNVENIPAFSWASVTFEATVNTNALIVEEGAYIAAVDNIADVTLSVPYVEGDPNDPWNDADGNPNGIIPETSVSMATNNVENPIMQDESAEPVKGVDTEIDEDGLFNNDGEKVSIGECVEYEIRFYNHYNRAANVEVTDVLDIGLDFVSASDNGTYDDETRIITWTIDDIPAFSWASVTFKATVNEEALMLEDGAVVAAVDNIADVKLSVPYIEGDPNDPWNDANGNPLNNLPETSIDMKTNSVENPIKPDDPIEPVKAVDTEIDEDGLFNNDGEYVNIGENIEYEIIFYNNNNTYSEITVTDIVDDGLDFVSASDDGVYNEETRTITWVFENFSAFTWGSVTFKATVNENANIIDEENEIASVDNEALVKIEVTEMPTDENGNPLYDPFAILEMFSNEVDNPILTDGKTEANSVVESQTENDNGQNRNDAESGSGSSGTETAAHTNYNASGSGQSAAGSNSAEIVNTDAKGTDVTSAVNIDDDDSQKGSAIVQTGDDIGVLPFAAAVALIAIFVIYGCFITRKRRTEL